ncbi:MAG: CPBP family intramembrane metalloprotease [Acidobacteriota bacterium]|nr:CPBP family intramembrane metalloprotease [Acidobacteriota bacterium]
MSRLFIARDERLRSSWRFVLGVLGVIVAEYSSRFVASSIAGGGAPAMFVFIQEPLSLGLTLLIFSGLLVVADRVNEDRLTAQGLPRSGPWLRQGLDGVLLGAGMVTACVLTVRLLGSVSFTVEISGRSVPALALVCGLLLVAAMKEEVVFRGYPFQRLVEAGGPRWGPVLGITVLSVLFGLVHWGNPSRTIFSTANTVLIGVVLAVAYLRTRALWLPIGIHFGWNFMLGAVFGLPVSGLNAFAVFVHGRAIGPLWLTGGDYGIEASAVATVVVLLSLPAIFSLYRPPTAGLEVINDQSRKPVLRVDVGGAGGTQS